MAPHPLEVAEGVADGVHAHVAHVQPSRRVGEHGEDIKLLPALSKANMCFQIRHHFLQQRFPHH